MTTTNFPDGMTNVLESAALGSFIAPAVTAAHIFLNDFDTYLASDWVVVETQAGATQALGAGDGGQLVLVNSAADDDINAIRGATLGFVLEPGKSFWLACRAKLDDVIQSEFIFGLFDTLTAFNPADGVYIYKADGAVPLRLSIEKLGVTTNASSDSSATAAANNTFFDLAITYNADTGVIKGWVGGQAFAQITNLTNLPTLPLAPGIGVRNGEAVAKTLTVDYLMAAKQR